MFIRWTPFLELVGFPRDEVESSEALGCGLSQLPAAENAAIEARLPVRDESGETNYGKVMLCPATVLVKSQFERVRSRAYRNLEKQIACLY